MKALFLAEEWFEIQKTRRHFDEKRRQVLE